MPYLRLGLILTMTLTAGACVRSRGGDVYIVPAGHPADPYGRPGAALVASQALEPALQTVTPETGAGRDAPQSAPSGGHQHQH